MTTPIDVPCFACGALVGDACTGEIDTGGEFHLARLLKASLRVLAEKSRAALEAPSSVVAMMKKDKP